MNSHTTLPVSCLNTQEKIVQLLKGNGEITTDQIMERFETKYHETIAGTALTVELGMLATHERIKMHYDPVEGRSIKLIQN